MSRVAITAFDYITPAGSNATELLQTFKHNNPPFQADERFDGQVICPVRDFQLKEIVGRHKNLRYLNRGSQFALAAAYRTVKKSGLDQPGLQHCGLVAGTGPNFDFESELSFDNENGINWNSLSALWMLRFLPNTISSLIADMLDLHGENSTINTACASGLQAVGQGYRLVKSGLADCVLCGAGDSRLSGGGIMGYRKAQALSPEQDPLSAMRPFDNNRSGFVPGEGGAFFMLEDLRRALDRKAEVICEVTGFASSVDGYNMTAPRPDGRWAEYAITSALKDAALQTGDIDLISAHATGTELNDKMESELIARLFGHRPPVAAFKAWTGHLAAACGAAELALVLECVRNRYFPGIRNLDRPCLDKVNFLFNGHALAPRNVLLQNFGFGGQNAALVINIPGVE